MKLQFQHQKFQADAAKAVVDVFAGQPCLSTTYLIDRGCKRKFATEPDADENVAVYVKLPHGFFIATPVGRYNPDWAIAFRKGEVKHVYFVAETKGSMSSLELREIEQSKIHCAREHFRAISGANVVYDVVDSYQTLLDKVMR